MAVRASRISSGLARVSISIWISLFFLVGLFPFVAHAAIRYEQGETAVVGEFVYDDDFVATTSPCTVSIYDPSGDLIVNESSMTADINGWHYYNYSIASNAEQGTWPTTMTCGTVPTGDLIKVDKSFIVGEVLASQADVLSASSSLAATVPTNVWSNSTRSLTTFGTLVADVWANGTRTLSSSGVTEISTDVWSFAQRRLTDGTLDSGSLATAANVTTASTSIGLAISDQTTSINSNTNSAILGASTSIGSVVSNASSSIASIINTNTDTQISSAITTINNNTNATVLTASTSLVATIPTGVWANGTRTLSSFGTLAADVWNVATSSFLTAGSVGEHIVTTLDAQVSGAGGTAPTASDIWSFASRTLTDATLTSGSLATAANVNTASTSLGAVVNANTDSQITSAISTINSNTDSRVLTASSSLVATIPTSVWTSASRSLTTFGTLVSDVWANGTRTLTAGTLDTGSLATLSNLTTASSSLAAVINANTDTQTSGITSAVNANTNSASSSIAAVVNANTNSQISSAITTINSNTDSQVLTASSSLVATLPASVWAYTNRTLSSFGTLVSDIWSNVTRTLTSSTAASWSITLSDFGTITAGSNYLATVHTVFDGTLTDADSVPTVTLYDPSRNVVVSGVAMTRISEGTYTYSYTTASSAEAGTWETKFSVEVETGKTLAGNDYWEVASSPAQVIINSISDNTIPEVAANITITNEGLTGYEYQYEWCVVSDIDNPCGGGNDVFHATAAKFINPGEDFNTTLSATVSTAGDYYFKTVVYFGTDSSGASRSFSAVTGTTPPSGGGGGGGGGGSSGSDGGDTCENPADFNCDGRVNSIDFSILLYFWKSTPPFSNPNVDINNDDKIDSVDFSILLYQWGN